MLNVTDNIWITFKCSWCSEETVDCLAYSILTEMYLQVIFKYFKL